MKLSGFFILIVAIFTISVFQSRIDAEEFMDLSSTADNKNKENSKEVFYTCNKDKEMRWMRITYLKNGKCKTVYSKNGNATEVAQASSYDKCEETINNVKKNLEIAGYVCKEKTLLGELNIE